MKTAASWRVNDPCQMSVNRVWRAGSQGISLVLQCLFDIGDVWPCRLFHFPLKSKKTIKRTYYKDTDHQRNNRFLCVPCYLNHTEGFLLYPCDVMYRVLFQLNCQQWRCRALGHVKVSNFYCSGLSKSLIRILSYKRNTKIIQKISHIKYSDYTLFEI